MSELTDLVGSAAGGVASGPLSGIAAIVNAAKGIIGKFVTDPAQKLEAEQHMLDLQTQLQVAALDAETKDIQASAGANNGHYMSGVRATFGFTMISIYAWNLMLGPALHKATVAIPMNINVMFAVLLMGFVGVPAGIEAVKQIIAMPGDSSVSVLGVKATNKS